MLCLDLEFDIIFMTTDFALCLHNTSLGFYYGTVVKWVSIIWLFGKKNNASKKIWEFVVPEIFRILVNEPFKLAQKNAILC